MRLLASSGAFIAGVALGGYLGWAPGYGLPWVSWWIFLAAAIISGVVLRLKQKSIAVSVLAAILLIGIARGAVLESSDEPVLENFPEEGSRVTVTGVLVEDPAPASSGFRLRLESEYLQWEDVSSRKPIVVDVYVGRLLGSEDRSFDGFRYGDRYRASGRFAASQEGARAVGYISGNSAFLLDGQSGGTIRRRLAEIRETLSGQMAQLLPSDTAGLAAALVVGDRRRLDTEISSDFRDAGLSHVLAISGLHVSIVGGILLGISAAVLGRKRQLYLLVPLAGVWGYALLAGSSPAVIRAAGMFSLVLAAHAFGRQQNSLPALGLLGGIMIGLDPSLLDSLSFQLSFAAVAGIAAFTPAALQWWQTHIGTPERANIPLLKPAGWVYSGLATSMGATIMTVPVVASTFGATPLLGPIATLLALPVLPLLVLSSMFGAATGLVWTEFGQVLSWPAWLTGSYLIVLANLFASVPYGVISSDSVQVWGITLWYMALGAVYFRRELYIAIKWAIARLERLPGPVPRAPLWASFGLLAIAVIVWGFVWVSRPSDEMGITFFETSVGDLILIESPGGSTVLIDGALDPKEAIDALDSSRPFWDRSLDAVVLTHPDADHLGGLQGVLDRYQVEVVLDSQSQHNSALARDWQQRLAHRSGVIVARQGMAIALAGGGTLEVIWAGRPSPNAPINDASTVMMLRYGEVSVLLTGDITGDVEKVLAENGSIRSTILKVAHHGSNTSSTQEFLDAVSPAGAVVQAGWRNRFGHPTEAVMGRLRSIVPQGQVWVTKEVGDVHIRTDGRTVRVTTSGVKYAPPKSE